MIHPTAEVSSQTQIGTGTRIWHYAQIREGVVIGQNCIIGRSVYIDFDVRIGDNVKIQNNVSVYTGCILEDDVFCGPSMVFTNVVNPRSHVLRRDEYKTTLVRKGASLGANCTVVCGITIGRYAFIGAGSVVTKDVPDYALIYGNPAVLRGWMCNCGIKLAFAMDAATCGACGAKYVKRGSVVTEAAGAESKAEAI